MPGQYLNYLNESNKLSNINIIKLNDSQTALLDSISYSKIRANLLYALY